MQRSEARLLGIYKPQPGDEPEEPVNPGLEDNQLKVMSFNVRYSSGDDGANSWDNRKKAVPAMFADQQPTVLGVQEARLDQKTYMDENCAGYKSVGVGAPTARMPVSSWPSTTSPMPSTKLEKLVKLRPGTFWLVADDTPDMKDPTVFGRLGRGRSREATIKTEYMY